MKVFSKLYDLVLSWSVHRHATRYLSVVSFTESSFFPIPPDVLLAPMTLAPDIIEAVLEGRQPRQLDLQRLRGRTSQLPREWSAQRKVFGFAS